ncbi:hypothetical protein F5Y06DRAFT_145686 [Hypoxylon sp. FL0890]|nr:hypothetical protein F5Y06DRAFT_145686 [Hypoxylon sp. FL0890]
MQLKNLLAAALFLGPNVLAAPAAAGLSPLSEREALDSRAPNPADVKDDHYGGGHGGHYGGHNGGYHGGHGGHGYNSEPKFHARSLTREELAAEEAVRGEHWIGQRGDNSDWWHHHHHHHWGNGGGWGWGWGDKNEKGEKPEKPQKPEKSEKRDARDEKDKYGDDKWRHDHYGHGGDWGYHG